MNEPQPMHEIAVDRREETVTTQQPGFTTTEQVVHDVAAERRLGLSLLTRIMWTGLWTLEVLLGLRFFLKLIGANPASGFAWFIYGITGLFVAPFYDLVGTWSSGEIIFEVTTLIAAAIYMLVFWGLVTLLRIIVDQPRARTITRSTSAQTSDGTGSERTTHSTRSG